MCQLNPIRMTVTWVYPRTYYQVENKCFNSYTEKVQSEREMNEKRQQLLAEFHSKHHPAKLHVLHCGLGDLFLTDRNLFTNFIKDWENLQISLCKVDKMFETREALQFRALDNENFESEYLVTLWTHHGAYQVKEGESYFVSDLELLSVNVVGRAAEVFSTNHTELVEIRSLLRTRQKQTLQLSSICNKQQNQFNEKWNIDQLPLTRIFPARCYLRVENILEWGQYLHNEVDVVGRIYGSILLGKLGKKIHFNFPHLSEIQRVGSLFAPGSVMGIKNLRVDDESKKNDVIFVQSTTEFIPYEKLTRADIKVYEEHGTSANEIDVESFSDNDESGSECSDLGTEAFCK